MATERLDRFYECLRTPIRPGEPETQPFTLPAGVEPAPRNVLIRHADFEIPKPTIIGIGGFFVAWAGVALLIGSVLVAPFGAFTTKIINTEKLRVVLGVLVVILGLWTLIKTYF